MLLEQVDQEQVLHLAMHTNFPDSGTNFILVGTEEISYTGVSGNNLTGITRAVRGTTRAAHSDGATVTNSLVILLHGVKQHLVT